MRKCNWVLLQVLKQLYDDDILAEEALLAWADEKAEASAEDRVFLDKVRTFVFEWRPRAFHIRDSRASAHVSHVS